MKDLEFHPAANVFPLMQGVEFEELVESIRANGYDQRHPILLLDGQILDGRNRYRAALKANVEPAFEMCNGHVGNPYRFTWKENATRRHLEPGLRGACYARMLRDSEAWETEQEARTAAANAKRSEAAKEQHAVSRPWAGEKTDGRVSRDTTPSPESDWARKQASREAGVSEATMGRVFALEAANPELLDKVADGEITLNEALRQKRKGEVREKLQALPTSKFRVLYADPPWDYGDKREEIGEGLAYGPATGHYPSMSMAELTAIDIPSLAASDAVLFLWATSPLLPEALGLIKAWGFDYKAAFVWDKVRHNFGHYNSVRHELLLIGVRGSCLPDAKTLHDSVVEIDRGDTHSAKPGYFRELIDSMYTIGARIELFARGDLPATWTRWGAEVA